MISVVVFSYSQTLKIMLVEYAATEMDFLDDYSDADPNQKIIRGNGITTFLFHVAQCIMFCFRFSFLIMKSAASRFKSSRSHKIFNNRETQP